MSRRDRDRLLTAAKWGVLLCVFVGLVVVGLAIRDWEHQRIAEVVVERLRAGGGR